MSDDFTTIEHAHYNEQDQHHSDNESSVSNQSSSSSKTRPNSEQYEEEPILFNNSRFLLNQLHQNHEDVLCKIGELCTAIGKQTENIFNIYTESINSEYQEHVKIMSSQYHEIDSLQTEIQTDTTKLENIKEMMQKIISLATSSHNK